MIGSLPGIPWRMEKEQRGRKEGEEMPGRQVPIDVLTGSLSGNADFNPNFSTKWMNVMSSPSAPVRGTLGIC